MAGETLIAILILLPLITAAVSLAIKDEKLRWPLIVLPSAILIAASAMLLLKVIEHGPLALVPHAAWDSIILVLELVLLAYFLCVGVAKKHVLILGLGSLQFLLFCLFKFAWLPYGFKVQPVLYVDLLAVIMCLVISVVGTLIAICSLSYMQNYERQLKLDTTRQHIFFFFLVGFLGAMNGLVFANSLLWLLFFWKVTTLCCYQLIRHDLHDSNDVSGQSALRAFWINLFGRPIAIAGYKKVIEESALRALWMNLFGGVALLVGTILTFQAVGTLSLVDITGLGTVGPILLLPLALFCLAGFTKAAQVPFQSWLLGAMVAPTPVSALLHSATMVKAGVYLVLRLAPAYEGTYLSVVIAIFGAFVFMAALLAAIGQCVSKRALAYSTVANLGLVICLAGINTGLAVAAAMALIIFHAITKGLLFMIVGIIEQNVYSRDIEKMEGLTDRLPVISSLAIMGMIVMLFAPFGMLFTKWAGIQAAAAAIPASDWFLLVVILLAIGIAGGILFWCRWIGRLLSCISPGDGQPEAPQQEARFSTSYLALFALLTGAITLSILVSPLVSFLINPATVAMGYNPGLEAIGGHLKTAYGLFSPWALFIVIALAFLLPGLLIKVRTGEAKPVYLCGENHPSTAGPTFRSIADQPVAVQTGGIYWTQIFGEQRLNIWINGVGIILLAALFAGVIVWIGPTG